VENLIYEDELPETLSQEQYDRFFESSFVDGVRVGTLEHELSEHCWCEPYLDYVDPETGNQGWVHR